MLVNRGKNVKINLQNLQIENMSQLNLKIGPKSRLDAKWVFKLIN